MLGSLKELLGKIKTGCTFVSHADKHICGGNVLLKLAKHHGNGVRDELKLM